MPLKPDLHTIRISCRPEQTERVSALFEEEALAVSILAPPRETMAMVEMLVDGCPDAAPIYERLKPVLGEAALLKSTFDIIPVGNLDWIKKVSEDFPPLPVARWTVFGAAHRDKITDPALALQIDATSAFGTGEHPTTRGCLERLDELLRANEQLQNGRMLDMGCGSGILAMAFAKATRGRALGVDMDELSVAIAKDNAVNNGVQDRVRFEISMGYALPLIAQQAPYDLIMANIFADPLCEMAGQLKDHLKIGGIAILSGLLNTQADAVIKAHEAQGLKLVDQKSLGEWTVLALSRPI